jgi:hypothetical protein
LLGVGEVTDIAIEIVDLPTKNGDLEWIYPLKMVIWNGCDRVINGYSWVIDQILTGAKR